LREGLAPVSSHGLCGYVDRTGNVAIPLQFGSCNDFHEGLAAVCPASAKGVDICTKWGFIEKTGRFSIPPVWRQVNAFSNGTTLVE
jgi:hypothetical protein